MKQKSNQKFGRHARNPSSKNQAIRTAKNKRLRMEKHPQGKKHFTFADMTKEEFAKACSKAAPKQAPNEYTPKG
jgi:hypothetical protein